MLDSRGNPGDISLPDFLYRTIPMLNQASACGDDQCPIPRQEMSARRLPLKAISFLFPFFYSWAVVFITITHLSQVADSY
jgi:hypothetical protein